MRVGLSTTAISGDLSGFSSETLDIRRRPAVLCGDMLPLVGLGD